MDRIPGQTGYLQLNEEGAVVASSGDLENDERSAEVVMGLVGLTSLVDPKAFPAGADDGFRRLAVTYEDHCYVICLSNRKIHVVKKKLEGGAVVVA